ncbi:MAG TPA: hypothetical protein VHM01_17470 [Alphaproteobacteria bacterium]|nr:hypothetical protein [Alphaproteobacteria bacterium]
MAVRTKQPESDIQTEADLGLQRRTWRVQRVGWAIFAILVLAALAGAFGSGPLSRAEAGSEASGLRIEYERFARLHAATNLVIRADRRLARNDELAVILSGAALQSLELPSTMPPADGTGLAPDSVVLRFRTDRQPGELTVVLHAKPRRMGLLTAQVGLRDGPAHTIRQWVYP